MVTKTLAIMLTTSALALCACAAPGAAPMLAAAGSGVGVPPAAAHTASANEYTFTADQWAQGNGTLGVDYSADGTDILLLTSGQGGHRAGYWVWGIGLGDSPAGIFNNQRPVSLAVDTVAETGDGVYWIGLTNATTNRMDWLGPCTGPQTVPLNDATHRDCYLWYWDERYGEPIQNNGHLSVAIYRASGVVRVRSLTVTASSEYLACNPHRPPCVAATADGSGVTLTWLHVEPLAAEDAGNCAAQYEIWRKPLLALPVAPARELLGTVDAPTATYLDATAQPGTAYVYYVRAVNATGGTSTWSEWAIATVPE